MGKKILIIEDSTITIVLVKMRLENDGYTVISAIGGEAGLEKMREEKPDLVILDVRMPEMDGFEVCRIAKNDPELKNIPVIFLTTRVQKSDFEKGKEVGVDGHIGKPYEGAGLVKEIKKFLGE